MNYLFKPSKASLLAPKQVIGRGYSWISIRRGFIRTKRFSGVSAFLMLPAFIFGLLFLTLIAALLLSFFVLYLIFYLLISIPRLRQASRQPR